MKILYVTTVGSTMGFFGQLISEFVREGHTVDIACSAAETVPALYKELGCSVFPLSCSRSPLKTGNLKAVRDIRKIAADGHYDIVHCHTPIAAACTRLACRKLRKNGLRVIYTAHGFHFFKGAPLKNWLIYYPVEKFCARFTDVLVTINQEDYDRAKAKFKAGRIEYVPGVGVDLERFRPNNVSPEAISALKSQLHILPDKKVLLSVGELIPRKNHLSVIQAVESLNRGDFVYLIAGTGALQQELETYIRNHSLEEKVKLLGYRKDILELLSITDLFILPSLHEGLPVALMEAMACGVTVTGAATRGTQDLVEESGGVVFSPNDIFGIAAIIDQYLNAPYSQQVNMSKYSVAEINCQMKKIYFED